MEQQKQQRKMIDRRAMLRVKLKSLAEEARIIRHEERRAGDGRLRDELHLHRVFEVREEARATHVAYGLVRGMPLDRIEPRAKSHPRWNRVRSMLEKYGPIDLAARKALLESLKNGPPVQASPASCVPA